MSSASDFVIENGILKKYVGPGGDVVIPEGVTSIGDGAFSGCSSLKSVTIRPGVTSIGKDAFRGCTGIELTVPKEVWVCGSAFEGCDPDNITFEEGVSGENVFGASIDPEKPLKPYPKLPLGLVKKPEQRLWLVMGFCSAPEKYTGFILMEYARYAKAQKKRIIKKAQDCGFEEVLAYFGEPAPKAATETKSNGGVVSLSMTEEEAKKQFKYTQRASGISINQFNGVWASWQSQGNWDSHFFDGISNRLTIPDTIGGEPVSHVAFAMLPDDAVIFCNEMFFQKLKRSVRVSTACSYLEDSSVFPAAECDEIKKFMAKYPSDVAVRLMEEGKAEIVSRFLDEIKPTSKLLDEMLEKAAGKAELTALLLSRKESGRKISKKKADLELSFEEKPLSVSELKKLWTWSLYSSQEAPGEELVELKHYKGLEKKVVVPGYFGKNPLGSIHGWIMEGHDDVTEIVFPSGEYKIDSCSLNNCRGLADPQGYIVVHAGDRVVLMDYIGDQDLHTLTLPEGITEIRRDAFRYWRMNYTRMREVVIPKSCKTVWLDVFSNCEQLQRIVFSEGIKAIHLDFYHLPALKELYIPASVIEIDDWENKPNDPPEIHGAAGSAAEAFAQKYHLEFVLQTGQEH